MGYVNVDDQEWAAPWVAMVGNAAYGVLNRMRSYCACHYTDGDLPEAIAVMCAGPDGYPALEALERAGVIVVFDPQEDLGVPVDERQAGRRIYRIKDYLTHNMSAARWAEIKEARSAAGRKGGRARGKGSSKR